MTSSITIDTHQMTDPASPFHAGEKWVQERQGVRGIERYARNFVRDYLPAQHRDFYTALPFLIVSARDDAGRPWATLLEGDDGFVTSPDAKRLSIAAAPVAGDALADAFVADADVGILGIEFATRRRNRVNGRITASDTDALSFEVAQTFGNCPQYIRERAWTRVDDTGAGPARRGDALSRSQRDWIGGADTLFIASGYTGDGDSATFGMDASHRGGDRGFVQVLNDRQIRFPDFAGNNHFNTIGNMVVDPRAGFLFVDFDTGSLLQLSGTVSIEWDGDAVAASPGAQRLVTLDIEAVVELPGALRLRWQQQADAVRTLRLVDKIVESDDVASFVFAARDGGALPAFAPGQHLPIELPVPGSAENTRRTYSLSSSPDDARYRISVKREPHGLASRFMHDYLEPGVQVESRNPAGDFVLRDGTHPVVLISAGIGVTPMISMLHALSATDQDRPVWFVHGARDRAHHALADEVRDLAARRDGIRTHVAYSRPGPHDVAGRDYDSVGRVDGALVASLVDGIDADYYLCGPLAFMADVQADLEARSVSADRIHTETFGPTG